VVHLNRNIRRVFEKYFFAFVDSGIKGLGRCFRVMDDDRSRTLDFAEFKKGMHDFGVDLEPDEIKELFYLIDKDKSGTIDFDEFLVKLRPPLSQARRKLILAAFHKLDRTGNNLRSRNLQMRRRLKTDHVISPTCIFGKTTS